MAKNCVLSVSHPWRPSALKGARSQTEAAVGLSQLLFVPGLDQPIHHCCQGHAAPGAAPQGTLSFSDGGLVAHGADEVGADFTLTLAHLQTTAGDNSCRETIPNSHASIHVRSFGSHDILCSFTFNH